MSWIPRSGLDEIEGVVWLPRLLEKARRAAAADSRSIDGYCYGDNDFVDAQVLRFLRISDDEVLDLVREHRDDADVAAIIVQRSGRSSEEVAAFNKRLRRSMFDFALMEADEGRMAPGFKRNAITFFYNRLLMPIVYAMFARAERARTRA